MADFGSAFDLLFAARRYRPGVPGQGAAVSVFGALVGDALGVPHEGSPVGCAQEQVEMRMPPGFNKAYGNIPYGTWSDDGSQMLCLLSSVMGSGGVNLTDFGQRLLAWYASGYHQSRRVVFDIGSQSRLALTRLAQGVPPQAAGTLAASEGRGLKGNGSLMRVLPIAFLFDEQEALQAAIQQSSITHANPVPQIACALYVHMARMLRRQPTLPVPQLWEAATAAVGALGWQTEGQRLALLELVNWRTSNLPTGQGFVADSLASCLFVLEHSVSYVDAVRRAVSLGHDTDTTACLVGGLAALRWGMADVPLEWVAEMDFPPESLAALSELQRRL